MDKNDFTEMAYNDHRTALLSLWDLYAALKAEQDATQATVLEVAAAVNAPADE